MQMEKGRELIPTLFGLMSIQNGYNHLLQYNLPNRHRIILRINQMHEIQTVT